MAVKTTVLFGRPQQEIASLFRYRLTQCTLFSLVAGFMTVEGVEAIAAPLRLAPTKLACLVVGSGTWRAFDALDNLVTTGVALGALFVHLGHSRATGQGAVHRFYRYHPMLHSKVYLFEMNDGTTAAFVGSHNLTGFALLGLNGEASILLEGESNSVEFDALRKHIGEAASQAVQYDPTMKEAYSWWTTQYLDGLRMKTDDISDPDDVEKKRTIVVIASFAGPQPPKKDDIIYFEIPEALGQWIRTLRAEVHIYLFSTLPSSPQDALSQLASATKILWCKTEGLEMERGGVELLADWQIENRRQPELKTTAKPFRPTPSAGMQQVRVRVRGPVFGKFEYLFDRGRIDWMPLFDSEASVVAPEIDRSVLARLELVPREDQPWYRIRGFEPAEPSESDDDQIALRETAPESGTFILFSLRRRNLNKREASSGRSA
jgi:HKD family nuclease